MDGKFWMSQHHWHCISVQDKKPPRSQLQQITQLTETKDFLDKDPELWLFSFFSVILNSAGASKYYYNSTSQKGKKKD